MEFGPTPNLGTMSIFDPEEIKEFTIDDYNFEKKALEDRFAQLNIKPEEIESKLFELDCSSNWELAQDWIDLDSLHRCLTDSNCKEM